MEEQERIELSKKRTQKYMWVSTEKWVELFYENLKLKEEIKKLKNE